MCRMTEKLLVIRKRCCPLNDKPFYEKPSVLESLQYSRWYKHSNKVNTCDERWQFQTKLSMMNRVLHMSPTYVSETSTKKTRIFTVVLKVKVKGDGLSFTSLKCFKGKKEM
jgi:hypothetical protein